MGLNSVSDLLQGVKRLFVGLQGVKSDGVTMENIKTNDVGAMKVSAELTGSNVEQTLNAALPAKAILMGISDGTNIQAMRGTLVGTLLASAARTSSTNSPAQINYNARGVAIFVDVTAVTDTPTLTPALRMIDSVTGKALNICTWGAINPTGAASYIFILCFGGGTDLTNTFYKSGILPRSWDFRIVHSDADSATYSVGYSLF